MKKNLLLLFAVFLIAHLGFILEARQSGSIPNSLGIRMIRITPGTFPMGSSIKRDLWNEKPVHEVTISQSFNISETEVTIEQFRQFKPDFEGTPSNAPYAAGVSWHDAKAFTEWLSRKEGKPYCLPTEAEWEYVARAGSDDPQSQAKNQLERPNAWGVKNMLAGPKEWCLDWFGEYPSVNQIDPVGPESWNVRIVRGGTLDLEERNRGEEDFSRPQARLAMPPSFGPYPSMEANPHAATGDRSGLIGVWYRRTDFRDPQETDRLSKLNNNWSNDQRGGGRWSARWRGFLEGPYSGEVAIVAEVEGGLTLEADGKRLIDAGSSPPVLSAAISMVKGRKYPVVLTFARSGGSSFRLHWQWPGQARELIPNSSITHGPEEEKMAQGEAKAENRPGTP